MIIRRLAHQVCIAMALSMATAFNPAVAEADTSIHKIRGFLPDLKFTLMGANDREVTADDLKGKTILLFFGYANCPDICPTTMLQLAEVIENLGAQKDEAQVVFISVDPHSDKPDMLQEYVNLFTDDALGLTGSEKQIADVARRYRVSYQIEKPKSDDDTQYEVAHSRGIYIFDKQGKARLLASDGESVAALTKAVKQVLAQ